ncbi:MAG: AsmA family protein [Gammaproteobacteria bacterium]|nr:AsmA family protein [Gammaproteobacteria bacterium]
MNVNRRIVKLLKTLFILLIVIAVSQGLLVYIGISFTSDKAKVILLEQISILTQREAYIDGEVRVTISMLPELLVKRIRVKNAEGFGEEDFIALTEARVQLSLLSLLGGKIDVTEFIANRAHIELIVKSGGNYNWSFNHLTTPPERKSYANDKAVKDTKVNRSLSVDRLVLTDITFRYVEEANSRIIDKHFSRILLDLEDTTEPRVEITGTFQDYPYTMMLESEALEKLSVAKPWNLSGSGMIAGRRAIIDASVLLSDQDIAGDLSLNFKDVSLGRLLERAGLITSENTAAAKELNIKVTLQGTDVIEMIRDADIELQLEHGYWRWRSLLKDEIRELAFKNIAVRASWRKAVQVHLDGKLFADVIQLDLRTNRLSEFFDDINKLDVDLTARVAGSDIVLNGIIDLPVKKKQFQLDIMFKGDDLEKLNRILNSELPPFNDYYFKGKLSANDKGFIVRADDASIGETHFKIVIVIDTSSYKPFWTINLNSRQFQIKDFEFANLQGQIPDAQAISTALLQESGELKEEPGRRLTQIVKDPKMHFDLNLKVEKLLAGETALGPSSLGLKLRDNTLIIDKADFDVPGGKIKSAAAFKIENDQVKGAFKLDIDKFDYGAVARYFNLGSAEGGVISARIDLKIAGRDFSSLFDHATGKLDVALWPRNTQTELFHLWATNLFLMILPEIRKREDNLNCIVALLDLDDGIMKEDFFGIDTKKVWMHGNIEVDFRSEQLKFALYPRSKKAKLFAVQSPIRAEGSLDDIRLNTNPVDLTFAYLSFITSPLHVPARRILGDSVPEDGSEKCEQFFDRDYVKKLKEKIEQEEQKEIDEWLDSD